MAKKNCKQSIEECLDGAVSAHECTGALQHISIDPDEVAKFHKQFNS